MPTTDAAPGNGEQKVTNATVALKIDHLSGRITEVLDRLDKSEAARQSDHDRLSTVCTRVDTHDTEINKLRGQSTFWNIANSIGAIAAAIFGGTR